jgi:hypothetical protein
LFPIAFGYWIIRLTSFNALRFQKFGSHYNLPIPLRL